MTLLMYLFNFKPIFYGLWNYIFLINKNEKGVQKIWT